MQTAPIARGPDVGGDPAESPDERAGINPLRSVLVGVDFSPVSATALKQGARIARWNRAKLHALHVIDMVVVMDLEAALSPMQQRIQEGIVRDARAAWDRFRAGAGLEGEALELEVEIDNRVAAVLRQVNKHSADLLVMGTHALEEPERGTGPLATACVRQAPCDVLLVRDPHDGPFMVVVACVDFSDTSRRALGEAVRIAVQDGAALHVLHVYRPPWQMLPFQSSLLEVPAEVQQQYQQGLRRRLEAFCQPLCHELRYVRPVFALVEHASHGRGIYEYARAKEATLVVLGTRGRSNVRDALIGSTAERVVRRTPCSVLAVKPESATA